MKKLNKVPAGLEARQPLTIKDLSDLIDNNNNDRLNSLPLDVLYGLEQQTASSQELDPHTKEVMLTVLKKIIANKRPKRH